MIRISASEVDLTIDFEGEGDRSAFVETLVELFGESEYLLSDIATNEGGRFVDLRVETASLGGYLEIVPLLSWLKGVVAGITKRDDVDDGSG